MSDGARTIPNIGETAPDFTLLALDGGSVSLSRYRGKRVAVYMWASWVSVPGAAARVAAVLRTARR